MGRFSQRQQYDNKQLGLRSTLEAFNSAPRDKNDILIDSLTNEVQKRNQQQPNRIPQEYIDHFKKAHETEELNNG